MVLFLLVGGFIAVVTFAGGAGSLYGIGFDLRWRGLDSGHVERHGLTKKTSKFRIHERTRVAMVPGETMVVDYSFQGDRGAATVSVESSGWVNVWGYEKTLASSSRFGTSEVRTLRAPADVTGFYEFKIYLHEAVGAVTVDWRVEDPRPLGRVLRAGQFVWFLFVGALILLIVVGIGRWLVGAWS